VDSEGFSSLRCGISLTLHQTPLFGFEPSHTAYKTNLIILSLLRNLDFLRNGGQ